MGPEPSWEDVFRLNLQRAQTNELGRPVSKKKANKLANKAKGLNDFDALLKAAQQDAKLKNKVAEEKEESFDEQRMSV